MVCSNVRGCVVPFALLEIATGNWFYLKMVTYHSLPIRTLTLERLLQFAFWEAMAGNTSRVGYLAYAPPRY